MKKKESDYTIAVLIDGDNVSHERADEILHFAQEYGTPVVKRVYGDWTRRTLAKWKEAARTHSFRLVEAPCYTSGKNTTDMALTIDAMDILHEGKIDCFCIAASDGDYTMLAQRIREAGLTVLGYGETKTPEALVASCLKFRYAGGQGGGKGPEPLPAAAPQPRTQARPQNSPEYFIERDMALFGQAFDTASAGKEEVLLSQIGSELKKLIPRYNINRYGCKTLGDLYKKLDGYELVKTDKGVAGLLRRKKPRSRK